ncbi:hypothetical protein ABWM08_014955 [Acinetobacter baumannii]
MNNQNAKNTPKTYDAGDLWDIQSLAEFDMNWMEVAISDIKNRSVHDKFHRTLILSGFCLLKIAKISLNSSFFPKPIKR